MTLTGLKRFCCEGCDGIYRMLHEEEILPEQNSAVASDETGK